MLFVVILSVVINLFLFKVQQNFIESRERTHTRYIATEATIVDTFFFFLCKNYFGKGVNAR